VGVTCGTHGGGVYRVLVGRPDGMRPQGRPRRRWENIEMVLRYTCRGELDSVGSG